MPRVGTKAREGNIEFSSPILQYLVYIEIPEEEKKSKSSEKTDKAKKAWQIHQKPALLKTNKCNGRVVGGG